MQPVGRCTLTVKRFRAESDIAGANAIEGERVDDAPDKNAERVQSAQLELCRDVGKRAADIVDGYSRAVMDRIILDSVRE